MYILVDEKEMYVYWLTTVHSNTVNTAKTATSGVLRITRKGIIRDMREMERHLQ